MTDRIFRTTPRRQLKYPEAKKSPPKIYLPIAPLHLSASERLKWSMETILTECLSNGAYPYGKNVSIQEILRRASLSEQYLEKPRRKEDKKDVKKFLSDNGEIFRSRSYRSLRETKASPSGTREESAELRRIRDCMILLELELDTANKHLARERALTTQLNAAIDQLRGGSQVK